MCLQHGLHPASWRKPVVGSQRTRKLRRWAAPDFDGRVRRLGPWGAPAAFERPRGHGARSIGRPSISRDEHGFGAHGASGSGSFWCLEGREVGSGARKTRAHRCVAVLTSSFRRRTSAPVFFMPKMMLRLGGCPGGARRVRRVVLAVDAAPDGRSSRLRRSWGVSGGLERRSQVAWWSDSWEFDQI